jgi:phospholipid transport system substrate-binding protein
MRALRRAALAALILAAALPGGARAGEPAEQLSAQVHEALGVLNDASLDQAARRQALRRIAEGILDVEEISRRSLGRHWDERTPAERAEFTQAFARLLERAYIAKIQTYTGERVAVLGDTVEGEQATVKTRIVTKQATEIPVEYRMLRRGDRWRAYDVVIDGISLVANYRVQFDKVIKRTSYQQLVRQVRDKQ